MNLKKMLRYLIVVSIIVSLIWAREPKCTAFEYDERLLSKLIRLEMNFENLIGKVKVTDASVKDGLVSLADDRARQKQTLDEMGTRLSETLDTKIKDVDKIMERVTADTVEKVRELEEFKTKNLGAVYTRWGSKECPSNATTIYEGIAAGSDDSHKGGAVETLCLPSDPQWGASYPGLQGSYIYSAEYDPGDTQLDAIFGKSIDNMGVPCAVCKATGRPTMMMVPARTECYSGWFREYTGYLMTNHHTLVKASVKCVDGDPETSRGSSNSDDGDLFYFMEAQGAIPDPPYTRGKELTCVVCTQ